MDKLLMHKRPALKWTLLDSPQMNGFTTKLIPSVNLLDSLDALLEFPVISCVEIN